LALDELAKRIQNEELNPKNDITKTVLETIISFVADPNPKIAHSALQATSNMIIILTRLTQNYLKELAPKLLFSMSSEKEPVSNISNFVFQLLETNYGSDKLIPYFIQCLDPPHLTRVKAGALEVLNILIKMSKNFFTHPENAKLCTQKVGAVINEYYNTKNSKILLPALGVLLALRDKNYEETISTILEFDNPLIFKIKEMSSQNAPDLESNMESFISRDPEKPIISKISPSHPKIPQKPYKTGEKDASINIIRGLASKKYSPDAFLPPDEELKDYIKNEAKVKNLNELLDEELVHTPEEIKTILETIQNEIKSTKNNKDIYPKIIRFIFNNAIFGAEELLQNDGFAALNSLIENSKKYIENYLSDIISNLIKCYIFPKKSWEIIDKLFNKLCEIFTPTQIILEIIPAIKTEKQPILQNIIRTLTNSIKMLRFGELQNILDQLKETLFDVFYALTIKIGYKS